MEKTTIKLLKSKQKIAYTYDNPLIASNPSTQLQRNIDVFFNTKVVLYKLLTNYFFGS